MSGQGSSTEQGAGRQEGNSPQCPDVCSDHARPVLDTEPAVNPLLGPEGERLSTGAGVLEGPGFPFRKQLPGSPSEPQARLSAARPCIAALSADASSHPAWNPGLNISDPVLSSSSLYEQMEGEGGPLPALPDQGPPGGSVFWGRGKSLV